MFIYLAAGRIGTYGPLESTLSQSIFVLCPGEICYLYPEYGKEKPILRIMEKKEECKVLTETVVINK